MLMNRDATHLVKDFDDINKFYLVQSQRNIDQFNQEFNVDYAYFFLEWPEDKLSTKHPVALWGASGCYLSDKVEFVTTNI